MIGGKYSILFIDRSEGGGESGRDPQGLYAAERNSQGAVGGLGFGEALREEGAATLPAILTKILAIFFLAAPFR